MKTASSSSNWIRRLFSIRTGFFLMLAYGLLSVLLQTQILVFVTGQSSRGVRNTGSGSGNDAANGIITTPVVDLGVLETLPPRNTVPLPAVQAFRQWQSLHSVAAIRANPHNRTYILAFYSCPRQAGNILHEFMNAVLQAVATNRTLLVEYRVAPYWGNIGENDEEWCNGILQRAPWMASFVEWNATLNLEPAVVMQHNHSRTYKDLWERLDNASEYVLNHQQDLSKHQVIEPCQLLWGLSERVHVWRGLLMLNERRTALYISQLYNIPINLDKSPAVHALYSSGVSFLYGMLMRECFGFTDAFLDTVVEDWHVPNTNNTNNASSLSSQPTTGAASYSVIRKQWNYTGRMPKPDVYTIGLHSRHMYQANNGTDVTKETKCLDRLLKLRGNESKMPCTVYIMSDRAATLQNLITYLIQTHQCTVVTAAQPETVEFTKAEVNKTVEHGPFAGTGFFRDLVVVSQAQDAFVGSTRSSSALVDEWMDYDRRNSAWVFQNEMPQALRRCYIENPNQHQPPARNRSRAVAERSLPNKYLLANWKLGLLPMNIY